MCGIAGISLINKKKKISKNFLKVSDFLSHRGPDSKGSFHQDNISLIHTRLSIIDVNGGKQPIENQNSVLVANGEIYNDREIRKDSNNFNFLTKSDSESIICLYEKYGLEGFKMLRGMYAFALYDKKKKKLFLSRDEFGIKPLYFSFVKDGLIFSSEIQAILNIEKNKYSILKGKLAEFLQLQFTSGNQTIFKNIFRVRPGETLIINQGKIEKSIINSPLRFDKKQKKSTNHNLISKTLEDSIRVHQRSEVPYCLFFSGGIDSFLILYFMNKIKKSKIKSYRVKFDDQNDISSEYIKFLSKKFNTDLCEINFRKEDFWNFLPKAAQYIDDPVADYAILPTLKLSNHVSKDGYKVVLSGEGGDEIFAGYGRYRNYLKLVSKSFFKGTFKKYPQLNKKFEDWDFELNRLVENTKTLPLSNLQKYQWFDFQNWLPNDLLVKLDRCLMAYGLEGRTPLIDKKVFDNFFFLDDSQKIKKRMGKFYIRDFLKNKIDFYNPFMKKKGFSVPIDSWIPEKIKLLKVFLPKVELLRTFFSRDDIIEICESAKFSKKAIKPLWHLIFASSWYAIQIQKIRAEGNFFDIMEQLK